MSSIKKHVDASLKRAALTTADLNRPGAHIMVADRDKNLHILVRQSKASEAIDSLDAEVVGYRGTIAVREEDPLENLLEDGGNWRDFVVTGLDSDRVRDLAEKGVELHVFSGGDDPGAAFFTSIPLAFAMSEVLDREQVAVRPVPPGEREGKKFVPISAPKRNVLFRLLGRWFDETVPADVLIRAAEAFQVLQHQVYDTGVIGALTLGLTPDRPAAPRPEMTSDKKGEGAHGLSAETTEYLDEALGIVIPEEMPSAAWVEEVLDELPEDAPEEVALELRAFFASRQEASEREQDDMYSMGEEAASKEVQPPTVYEGERSLQLSKRRRLSQIEQGVEGLGVPAEIQRRLAEQLAAALEPRKKPSLILVAGPKGSAADPLFDLAVSIVGKNPLRLMGGDLADPSWAVLFGHNRGFPTQGDAWLSQANIEEHRETPAQHVPITIEDLKAAGASDPENQTRHQQDLLARLAEWLHTGKVNVYTTREGGAAVQQEVPLANTVFLVRWVGSQEDLEKILKSSTELDHLAPQVIGLTPYKPDQAINALLRRAKFELAQHFGPKDCAIELDAEAQAAIAEAMGVLSPARGMPFFADALRDAIGETFKDSPSRRLEVGLSRRLTTRERQQLRRGERPRAPHHEWFSVRRL